MKRIISTVILSICLMLPLSVNAGPLNGSIQITQVLVTSHGYLNISPLDGSSPCRMYTINMFDPNANPTVNKIGMESLRTAAFAALYAKKTVLIGAYSGNAPNVDVCDISYIGTTTKYP